MMGCVQLRDLKKNPFQLEFSLTVLGSYELIDIYELHSTAWGGM